MGKGQAPTTEELKFIFELFAQGYSDQDVLGEYECSKKHGRLVGLPNRQDVRFIRQRRKEFEAARMVLESRLKRQIDPLVTEAERQHLQGIVQCLERWAKNLDMARNIGAYSVTYDVEGEPLFLYALKHCRSVADKYHTLKAQRDQYESIMTELAATIGKEAPPEATEYFSKFAASYAVRAALGESLPDYRKEPDFLRVYEGSCGWPIASGSADALDHCQEQHKALIGKYTNDPKVVKLLAIRDSLCDSQKALYEAVEQTLIKRSYTEFKCEACQDFGS
jgi:hypothetical protein